MIMSNEIQEDSVPSEMVALKKRADLMGLTYHPNIGLDKLKAKVSNALGDEGLDTTSKSKDIEYLTEKEFKDIELKGRKRRAGLLVRVNVTCMNPNKKEWEGEIFSVGSAKLGTFKKYIPFNTSDGWHIPHIMYEAMKERKCSVFHTVKDQLGNKIRKSRLIPEFSIDVLPPLDKQGLKDLAQRQALANSTGE